MARNARNVLSRSTSILTALGACAATALAGQQTWNFDVTTTGNPVFFTSPTAVDPSADQYDGNYTITLVEVDAMVGLFTINNFNATSQIDPVFLSGSGVQPGPCPVTIFSDMILYPPPPEEAGIAATLSIGLNANGFGVLSATDVFLGTVLISVPPFGNVQADLLSVRLVGSITVTPEFLCPDADLNGDCVVNASDLALLLGAWGRCGGCPQDLTGDGQVNAADLALLLGSWG